MKLMKSFRCCHRTLRCVALMKFVNWIWHRARWLHAMNNGNAMFNAISSTHFCLPHVTVSYTGTRHWPLATAAYSESPLYALHPAAAECRTRRLATERSGRQSHARSSSSLTTASSTQSKQYQCHYDTAIPAYHKLKMQIDCRPYPHLQT